MATDILESKTEQIGKLLIQAERTDNVEEKQAFFAKAQKLASTYSIELELARQKVLKGEKRETPIQKRIDIGEPGKPLNAVFCTLGTEIGEANDIRFNIAHNSTYLVAFGMPSDIAVLEAFYAHIAPQMIKAGDKWVRDGEWKGEMTWCTGTHRMKPVTARVARRCFYEEFIAEIGRRLRRAKREAEAAAIEAQPETEVMERVEENGSESLVTRETSLVLAEKAVEVADFYKQTSRARGTWKGNRGNTANSNGARSAGRTAGSNAYLGGGIGQRKQIG